MMMQGWVDRTGKRHKAIMERQILWHHLDGHFIKMVEGHLQNNNSFYSLYYPCAANLEMPMPEHPDRDELSHDQVVAAQ